MGASGLFHAAGGRFQSTRTMCLHRHRARQASLRRYPVKIYKAAHQIKKTYEAIKGPFQGLFFAQRRQAYVSCLYSLKMPLMAS